MSRERYAQSLAKVLVHEGGKVNNPKDPGGRTNQGVIQRVYDGWRRRKNLPTRTVYDMETAERDAIYKAQYWDLVRGDELPPGIDYIVFDGAVNSGPTQSVKWLQRALQPRYSGEIDGDMGEATLSAIELVPDLDDLVDKYCDRRMAFLRALRTWKTFGKGWTARVKGVRETGLAWANGGTAIDVTPVAGGEQKASIEDAYKAPTKAPGDLATGGGIVTTTLTQATDQLSPISDASPWIGQLVAILTVAGVLILVCGILYRIYAKKRETARADALDLRAGNDTKALEE